MPRVEQRIRELEHEYWDAVRHRDATTIARLTDDRCMVVGPQGINDLEARQISEMVKTQPFEIDDFALDEKAANVRLLGKNLAVVAYPVHERLTENGSDSTTLDAFDTSVWMRRDCDWRCVVHTETVAEAR